MFFERRIIPVPVIVISLRSDRVDPKIFRVCLFLQARLLLFLLVNCTLLFAKGIIVDIDEIFSFKLFFSVDNDGDIFISMNFTLLRSFLLFGAVVTKTFNDVT
ncbi:unnamed protein product [Rotaria socialis]|uniref:Uncharacterized protein n=1 Tax=Rotaria socialis TaxID=392032 RepID=A0A817QX84_9BILA|nr:unnamed protein product [Rotaria socialis]CAF3499734.1 unnamed protein product [Rotaria socialis]CAF3717251.1 unnamed protein product [Rotaria socialis]CAF4437149.1 unnamed protein product [Rotaria socialis]CAF4496245.1 unnamed protein product [Rotaria socialis]